MLVVAERYVYGRRNICKSTSTCLLHTTRNDVIDAIQRLHQRQALHEVTHDGDAVRVVVVLSRLRGAVLPPAALVHTPVLSHQEAVADVITTCQCVMFILRRTK